MMRFVEVEPGQVRVRTGDTPVPGPGEVRLDVTACGICGTDLHLLHGMVMPPGASYPVRPGHEVAGVVSELGDGVADVNVGDTVVAHPLLPCGHCEACRNDMEQRCNQAKILGIHAAGGMAESLVWRADRLVKTTLPPVQAALLPDAVATAWHAFVRASVPKGGTLVVMGAGGVGTHVIQLARAADPTLLTVAVVRSKASAQRLEQAGLGPVIRGLDGLARGLRSLVPPADAVIDFSGDPAAAGEGIRALRRGGVLVLGSIIDEPVNLSFTTTSVVTREISVVGSYSSTIGDLRAVADLVQSGGINLAGSASAVIQLGEAPDAFRRLEDRQPGIVRIVLQP